MLEFINYIKGHLHDFLIYDEAATRNSLIFPVLQKLGWNIFLRDEVYPEYPVESKRIDLSLRINNENKFFIEIKRCNVELDNHHEQLLNYSFRAGVKLATLTNGVTWQFFLPLQSGPWQKRLFFTLDIENQSVDEIAPEFKKLLSKYSIQNNLAIEYAEDLYSKKNREYQIRNNLPKAWERLLTEPTPELVDIISDKTAKMCGHRPNDEQVIEFINSISNNADFNNCIASACNPTTSNKFESNVNGEYNHSEFLKIKGLNIPIDCHGKYRAYFEEVIPLLIKIIPESELKNLENLNYINNNLVTRQKEFPLMSRDESKFISNGVLYAWTLPICGYFINKHWYKSLFLSWIKYLKILQSKFGE